MASPNRLAGTAYFKVNGVSYALVGTCEWSPSKVERETLSGLDGVHGFSEKPKPGHIAGQFRDSGKLSVAAINAMENVTVSLLLANGKSIVGRNMWTVGELTAKADDGTIDIRWEGPQGSVTEN